MLKKNIHKIVLFLLLLLWQQMLLAAPLQILGMHVTKNAAGFVNCDFTLSKAPLYRAFSLNNPARIVIDFDNTVMLNHLNHAELADTPIKNIRSGKHENNSLRVVIDTNKIVNFHVTTSKGKNTDQAHLIVSIGADNSYAEPKVARSAEKQNKPVINPTKPKTPEKPVAKTSSKVLPSVQPPPTASISSLNKPTIPVPVTHINNNSQEKTKTTEIEFIRFSPEASKPSIAKAASTHTKSIVIPAQLPPVNAPKLVTAAITPAQVPPVNTPKLTTAAITAKAKTATVLTKTVTTPVRILPADTPKAPTTIAPVNQPTVAPTLPTASAEKNKPLVTLSTAVLSTPTQPVILPPQQTPPKPLAAAKPQIATQQVATFDPKNSVALLEPDSKQKPRDIVVVIDPGHGGKDPGASGPKGTKEKDVVLAIAKNLQSYLNSQNGYSAVLTRDGDYHVNLHERLHIAHVNKADIFLSLHADVYKNSSIKGTTLFALSSSGTTSESARWLAEKENVSELGNTQSTSSTALRSILLDLAQKSSIKSSLLVGNAILSSLTPVNKLHTPRIEQADFVVLQSPDIPSLLVETGFISDASDEQRLTDPLFQEMFARALARGIMNYFTQHPPKGTVVSINNRASGQMAVNG